MPLFERPGGQFRLTAAGERLKRYAEDAIAGLRSLEQDVGLLKASAARRLQGGLEHYPGVEMHLMVDVPEPLFDALLRNSLDVACLMNTFVPSGLTAESLCDEELVIFASPRHPLARRRQIAPDELSRHPFVASTSPALRAHIDSKLRIAGVTPRIAAETLHHDAMKNLVAQDYGYSMVLRSVVADELARGQLVARVHASPRSCGASSISHESN